MQFAMRGDLTMARLLWAALVVGAAGILFSVLVATRYVPHTELNLVAMVLPALVVAVVAFRPAQDSRIAAGALALVGLCAPVFAEIGAHMLGTCLQ